MDNRIVARVHKIHKGSSARLKEYLDTRIGNTLNGVNSCDPVTNLLRYDFFIDKVKEYIIIKMLIWDLLLYIRI